MSDAVIQQIRDALTYDPETGDLTWAKPRLNRVKSGDAAGNHRKDGYQRIRVEQRYYYAHRLAWLLRHGVWPTGEVDHIDGNRANNRISNLRDVTKSVNQQNLKAAPKKSRSGLFGAICRGSKWSSSICINGKRMHLGTYPTAEAAHEAYIRAKREHHEGCTI